MRSGMRGLWTWLVLGVLVALCAPVPTSAQTAGSDEIEEQLRRTDEALERAAEVVHESESQRARQMLEQAMGLQRKAWNQFREGRPQMAARLTLEARKTAARALTIAREHRGLRARAERELEKAARALRRARDEIGDIADETAFRLLEEAHLQVQRGYQQLGEQHFEVALRLAISAQRLIHQAVGATPGHAGDRRIQRELERTDQLIDRAQGAVSDSDLPEAKRAMVRATELQQEAWRAYRSGQLRRALATTREARSMVNRALSLVRGPVDSDRVQKAILETDRLLERAADVIRETGHEQAMRVLEKATEHQQRARRLLDGGEFRAALAETRVARRLAMRALQMAQDGGAP